LSDSDTASLHGTVAAHTRWARETDRTAATENLRAGFFARLEREAREQLGPDATDEQVASAAESLLKAHYARMRLNSALSRKRAAAARRQAEAEAMADAIVGAESGG